MLKISKRSRKEGGKRSRPLPSYGGDKSTSRRDLIITQPLFASTGAGYFRIRLRRTRSPIILAARITVKSARYTRTIESSRQLLDPIHTRAVSISTKLRRGDEREERIEGKGGRYLSNQVQISARGSQSTRRSISAVRP